jgi:endoglucanase
MISEITEEGYLKFGVVGGMDPRVLCGRHVIVGDKQKLHGVIASKAIHLQTAEERSKATAVRKMYIDIGA